MKFALIFSVLAAFTVSAVEAERMTNAKRFSLGLPPLAPRNLHRGSGTSTAHKSSTSAALCMNNLLCCEETGSSNDSHFKDLASSCGQKTRGSQSASSCTKISRGDSCSHKTVCCGSHFDHTFATDCKQRTSSPLPFKPLDARSTRLPLIRAEVSSLETAARARDSPVPYSSPCLASPSRLASLSLSLAVIVK
ncbi:uncharacterized protein BXZ73DRAFT_95981 [Epithele typhae]|uniref:uncharacterized protein n=1 Tax=Epithele typhae TaxID=378194 RepID=UPI00200727AB|nr:uncharacterized protein BXZ73DRAFT_95981 [Epithele typhae]KAH9944994.1 hypothetical protein BXZ73DRAFT_95981 [Epithele typhae]